MIQQYAYVPNISAPIVAETSVPLRPMSPLVGGSDYYLLPSAF